MIFILRGRIQFLAIQIIDITYNNYVSVCLGVGVGVVLRQYYPLEESESVAAIISTICPWLPPAFVLLCLNLCSCF